MGGAAAQRRCGRCVPGASGGASSARGLVLSCRTRVSEPQGLCRARCTEKAGRTGRRGCQLAGEAALGTRCVESRRLDFRYVTTFCVFHFCCLTRRVLGSEGC